MSPLVRFLRRIFQLQSLVAMNAFVEVDGAAVVQVRRRGHARARCPHHGCSLQGALVPRKKRWRHLDLGPTRLYFEAESREGSGLRCEGRSVEAVLGATHRADNTSAFVHYVTRLVHLRNQTPVSTLAKVAWRTVGGITSRVVAACGPKNLRNNLVGTSMDKIEYKRGKRHLANVVDLETGSAVWSAEGMSADTLGKYLNTHGAARCTKPQVVAVDMHGRYAKTVRETWPNPDFDYDRFHVVELRLEAVDEHRRVDCAKLSTVDR